MKENLMKEQIEALASSKRPSNLDIEKSMDLEFFNSTSKTIYSVALEAIGKENLKQGISAARLALDAKKFYYENKYK